MQLEGCMQTLQVPLDLFASCERGHGLDISTEMSGVAPKETSGHVTSQKQQQHRAKCKPARNKDDLKKTEKTNYENSAS